MMTLTRTLSYSLLAALGAASACSAGGDNSGKDPLTGSTGGAANASSGGSWAGPSNGGGGPLGTAAGPAMRGDDPDASCAKLTQRPEEVVVYTPIALFVMQDRSSSMVGLLGDPSRWPNSTDALNGFVSDPNSAGIDVGLGFFPPMSNAAGDCAGGSDCGTPVAPIGPLPQNAGAIQQALQQATPPTFPPLLTPTECALRGMLNACLAHQGQTGVKCVAILVTDGEPTLCDLNTQNLVNVVTEGAQKGITTFAVALPGAQAGLPLLQQVAQAGGTTLVDLTAGGSQAAILTALNAIRTQVAVATKLDCQWSIPAPGNGQPFDKGKVNVTFTPANSAAVDFGHVDSEADCGRTVDGNGWYYDNQNAPTQVLVCPQTCTVIKDSGGQMDLQFGCETIPAKLQ